MPESNDFKIARILVPLVADWVARGGKGRDKLDRAARNLSDGERARLTSWFKGFLRSYRWWEKWLELFCDKRPKRQLGLFIITAFAVVKETPTAQQPSQVNAWVALARTLFSPSEAKLVNALLRRMLREADVLLSEWQKTPETWGLAWSHPDWLVQRWIRELGEEETRRLLEWNQQVPPVYLHWVSEEPPPAHLNPTPWPRFFSIPPRANEWKEWIAEGKAYIQDPATRKAVELLQPAANLSLLEFCAAPGGKSIMLARARQSTDPKAVQAPHLAIDLSGRKLEILNENLERYPFAQSVVIMPGDLLTWKDTAFSTRNFPTLWDQVFVDVPCSNTGVIARKPDVRFRLQESDLADGVELQSKMIEKAAEFVRPGGSLLYSTCSIEADENEEVIQAFLKKFPQWSLIQAERWMPSNAQHDGGGAFLLRLNDNENQLPKKT